MNAEQQHRRDLRVAEQTLDVVERRIQARMDLCFYCDQGVNAYREAENAIKQAIEDVRGPILEVLNVAPGRG